MKNKKLSDISNEKDFIEIGEEIINNAHNTEEFGSVEQVSCLTGIDSFLLGVSIILYGIETSPEGCNNILDKAIYVSKMKFTPDQYLN